MSSPVRAVAVAAVLALIGLPVVAPMFADDAAKETTFSEADVTVKGMT